MGYAFHNRSHRSWAQACEPTEKAKILSLDKRNNMYLI